MKSAIIRKVSPTLVIAAAFVAVGAVTPLAADDSNVRAPMPSVSEIYGRAGYRPNAPLVTSVVRLTSQESRSVDKIYGRASYDPYWEPRNAGSGPALATGSGKGEHDVSMIYGRS